MSPHPGLGPGVELDGGDPGGLVDVVRIDEAPPAMAVRREIRHQASCRLSQQAPTGQVAGDYGEVVGSGVGGLDRSEELLVAGAAAGRRLW